MKKAPLVSVIVPVYNVHEYLDKCVSSVLSQTYKNLEVILVDDGSKDGSERIVDDYKKLDKKIIVVHKKNGGLSSARNAGLKKATGEWVAFIDSDDYIDECFIERLLELAQKEKANIATCSFEPFSLDGSGLKNAPVWPEKTMTGTEAINVTMKNRLPVGICLSLFNMDLFKKNKIVFPEGREHEDLITRMQLLFNADKVTFTNEKLYKYLSRKESITGKKLTESRFNDLFAGINDIHSYLENKSDIKKYKFIEYFEFYSIFSILNYLAKEEKSDECSKKLWIAARKELKNRFGKVVFPTKKKKVYYRTLLMLSSSKKIYTMMYRRIKK